MSSSQILVIAIMLAAVGLFVWGRLRHDVVAVAALIACVLVGLIPAEDAFLGFAHPAVITVACVLILSDALLATGAIEMLAHRLALPRLGGAATLAVLCALAAGLSAFMNNVGALALLMPMAIQSARRHSMTPGTLLMPIAFASMLGGMITLVGTPPNLIVSGFRMGAEGAGFAMFDFAPVGLAVAVAGLAFMGLVGWRLVPKRQAAAGSSFEIGTYITEASVPEGSKAVGLSLRDVDTILEEIDSQTVGLVRRGVRIGISRRTVLVEPGDVLIIEADPKSLGQVVDRLGAKLTEEPPEDDEDEGEPEAGEEKDENAGSTRDDLELVEVAVLPGSELIGSTAESLRLRARLGISLLALSRQGRRSTSRLRTTPLMAGDVLLLQGGAESIALFTSVYRCVPLAERDLTLPIRKNALTALLVMAGGVALAAFGILPASVSFTMAVLALVVVKVISPGRIYEAIDWPVIVLLGALLPVANTLADTGVAALVADTLVGGIGGGNAIWALALILVVTMTLSDWINNAATAAVMCPIAISIAAGLGVSADPFLMAVAIGASCAFLTPIGHQNNTLILGPGGFRFGDYWRLGLPLEVIVVAVAVPLIPIVWPLTPVA